MYRCIICARFLLCLLFFACLGPLAASAQDRPVTGSVKDATTGAPLPGVSVGVKGSSKGVTTGADGTFSLQAPAGAVLVFTFIGYEKKESPVPASGPLQVTLGASASQLGEVVVTALGIERKTRSLGYATQQLNNTDLTAVRQPGANIMNSLNGKVAGAIVTPASTGPGGAVRVVLRGNKSITGNNNALIVVDGVPIDNTMTTEAGGSGSANSVATQQKSISSGYSGSDGAASINPDDVESINVLKGPAAAALYGSRAANGALIITTKSGKSGRLSVGYNGGAAVDFPYLLMKFQNEYGRGNGGVAGAQAGESWGAKTTTYKNNVRSFYQTGLTLNNSVNVSGGNDKLKGYASYTNNINNGIVPNNRLERNTLNLRVSADIVPRLTADVKLTYMNQIIKNKPRLGDNGVTNEALIMPRDLHPDSAKVFERYDATGQPVPVYWTNSSVFQNPYWDVNRTALNEERNRTTLLGTVKYRLTDRLSIQGRYSLDRYDDKITGSYYFGTIPISTLTGGRYQESYVNRWERNMDVLLSGSNTLGDDFGVNYNAGAAVMRNRGYISQAFANGLSIPNQFSLNFASTPSFSNTTAEKEIQSVYASAQFDFRQRIFLDLSARNDWSSTLPPPHSYFYPSAGLSAILSDLLSMPEWVTFGKVRAAYTRVGNDADPYLLLQTYSYSLGAGNGFVSRDQTKNIRDLKPELTESWEAGAEWRFFDGRLGLDATVYNSNTINQLVFIGLPQPAGFVQQYINVGNIRNRGLEVMLTGTPVRNGKLTWNTSVNFALNRSTALSLRDGITQVALTPAVGFASLLIKPGGRYGDMYDYVWAKDEKTGQYRIDANGLPVVTPLQYIGNFNPDYTLGWNNTFQYGNFRLGLLIDGRVGGTVISGTDAMLAYFGIGDYTARQREGNLVLPGIAPDGSQNTKAISAEKLWTAVSQGGRNGYGQFFAFDATSFRLRELSLGYDFDIKNKLVKTARLSLSGRNLFFFYRGKSLLDIPGIGKRTLPVDPEVAIGASNYQGIESGILPITRSFGLNLGLTF
ncbi:SusC/RagA family TonB-linked outer membrane protein [Chitinophaga lutea]